MFIYIIDRDGNRKQDNTLCFMHVHACVIQNHVHTQGEKFLLTSLTIYAHVCFLTDIESNFEGNEDIGRYLHMFALWHLHMVGLWYLHMFGLWYLHMFGLCLFVRLKNLSIYIYIYIHTYIH